MAKRRITHHPIVGLVAHYAEIVLTLLPERGETTFSHSVWRERASSRRARPNSMRRVRMRSEIRPAQRLSAREFPDQTSSLPES